MIRRLFLALVVLAFAGCNESSQVGSMADAVPCDVDSAERVVYGEDVDQQLTPKAVSNLCLVAEEMKKEQELSMETLGIFERPSTAQPPEAVPPVFVEGIKEKVSWTSSNLTLENAWSKNIDGMHITVLAGSETAEPSKGVLVIDYQEMKSPYGHEFEFLVPPIPGPLRIVSADGLRLTLVSETGAKAVFDMSLAKFL